MPFWPPRTNSRLSRLTLQPFTHSRSKLQRCHQPSCMQTTTQAATHKYCQFYSSPVDNQRSSIHIATPTPLPLRTLHPNPAASLSSLAAGQVNRPRVANPAVNCMKLPCKPTWESTRQRASQPFPTPRTRSRSPPPAPSQPIQHLGQWHKCTPPLTPSRNPRCAPTRLSTAGRRNTTPAKSPAHQD
jgi:hypothetical protein